MAQDQAFQPLALEEEADFHAVAGRAGTAVAPCWPPEVERTAVGGCASHRGACRRSQALAGWEVDTAGATDGRETTYAKSTCHDWSGLCDSGSLGFECSLPVFSLQFSQHIGVAQPGPGSLCVWTRFREGGKCLSHADAPCLPGLSRGQWPTVTDTAQPRAQVGGPLFHFHMGLQILSALPGILPLHAQY